MERRRPFAPVAELSLFAPDGKGGRTPVFDGDLARLCLGVRESGSLYESARNAGFSYNYAWKKISRAEEALGSSLFLRRGCLGTTLSDEGVKLLDAYLAVCDALAAKVEELAEELAFSEKRLS